jgi:hypothetical protein
MLGLEALGQFADAGPVTAREALRVQQQLVLQGGQTLFLAEFLADAQESPQPITEAGNPFVIVLAQGMGRAGFGA